MHPPGDSCCHVAGANPALVGGGLLRCECKVDPTEVFFLQLERTTISHRCATRRRTKGPKLMLSRWTPSPGRFHRFARIHGEKTLHALFALPEVLSFNKTMLNGLHPVSNLKIMFNIAW